MFDFWNTIAYRVKICKSPTSLSVNQNTLFFEPYLYHVDGSKTKTAFRAYSLDSNKKPSFITIQPQNMTAEKWKVFIKRINKILSTMVLSINTLKQEVDSLNSKLKKYDEGKIDTARLLGFEENNIITVIDVTNQLYRNKDKYDKSKSFNQNLSMFLNLNSDTITRTQEDKTAFLTQLVEMDKNKTLSDYIHKGIDTFYELYKYEMQMMQQNK